MILIREGVSGSGKTTLAKTLAKLTGWQFAEGDDYHSEANRQKMHSGIPLTDEDRAPWLATLHGLILQWHQRDENGILTCSALKQIYRQTLTADLPAEAYRFVLMDAPKEVISQRMHARQHFMPANCSTARLLLSSLQQMRCMCRHLSLRKLQHEEFWNHWELLLWRKQIESCSFPLRLRCVRLQCSMLDESGGALYAWQKLRSPSALY